jgi:hypothetical protein
VQFCSFAVLQFCSFAKVVFGIMALQGICKISNAKSSGGVPTNFRTDNFAGKGITKRAA